MLSDNNRQIHDLKSFRNLRTREHYEISNFVGETKLVHMVHWNLLRYREGIDFNWLAGTFPFLIMSYWELEFQFYNLRIDSDKDDDEGELLSRSHWVRKITKENNEIHAKLSRVTTKHELTEFLLESTSSLLLSKSETHLNLHK